MSGFSIDREKIEFFKQGNELKDKLERSERKRKKIEKEKKESIKEER